MAHEALKPLADDLSDQVKELRDQTEGLLREHKKGIIERQFQQKRLADAVSDIYAQVAVLSRVTAILEEHGVEPSGQERYIAETFCTRAGSRVRQNFGQIEKNDDDRMTAIAKLALKRGEYGYAFFED
jgi:acyl-CoA dehydrogenase family protein 9